MFRVIIAGCGAMAHAWIEPMVKRDDCVIVGLVDVNESSAIEQKSKYALEANVYTSLSEAIKNEKADIVADITPPQFHKQIVTEALGAGLHVFGEKPMSDNLADAELMVECAENSGKEYFVLQNYRYNPQIRAFKEFIASDAPGTLGRLSADFLRGIHFGGFREEMPSPLIADMAIHTFDAARYISGSRPEAVYCHEFNPEWSWYKGNASANCIFEMEGGLVFDYRGTWCEQGFNNSWNSEWRASCANGTVVWDGHEKLLYHEKQLNNNEGRKIEIPVGPASKVSSHESCIDDMFAALKTGTRPQTDCRDNIHSIRMVFKSIESAKNKARMVI
ncbi:MAG: Gfo/Idh/MocA family oxidoreductase [Defluviitaleaceae bacterium]|nr:Gfo/Idh/MocA family oxidoreductase [Defluviitaleaceae bacterium]MCL2836209.1 Gfo/Idh/MocA family oxidoreductase [Defluviitaleaceae bacterium]